jgi:hypothetical protein
MAHQAQTINYSLTRGLPWERLIIIKDRRTHRLYYPTDARAYIKTGDLTVAEITTTITTERGVELSLTSEETQDLPLGDLSYDVLATVNGIQTMVARGTITVSALDNITPLEDALAMEIRFKKYTDFRQSYTWKDSDGNILTVTDAFMQAKNDAGTTVLDLRWYSSAPNEATIIALSPANKRGYIAPKTGYTLEIHISDTNGIPAGSYPFDLFVKDSAGDWSSISQGQVVVEPSTSTPPV